MGDNKPLVRKPSNMKSIIILEDDEGIRELIQLLLESRDYQVKAFAQIKAFDLYLQEEKYPDLFLLDYMLPDGNGLEVCHKLKDDNDTNEIPVIIMSAHADLDKMKGADDYIAKPFDVDGLVKCIQKQMA